MFQPDYFTNFSFASDPRTTKKGYANLCTYFIPALNGKKKLR